MSTQQNLLTTHPHQAPVPGNAAMPDGRGRPDMDVSIIICTHDRPEGMSNLLASLQSLAVPEGLRWEVLVIGNNSTDATRKAVDPYVEADPRRFRFFFEKGRGKSYALNTGIRRSQGRIIAFTDDDCIVDPHWISCIMREYDSDPDLAVLSGRIELYNKNDRAMTISLYRERAVFSPTRLFFDPLVIGANMAFKREVFETVGMYDTALSPGSKSGAEAEDADMVYRTYRKGFKIAYSPIPLVYHNHGRKTENAIEALERHYWMGRGSFYCKHVLAGDLTVARLAYWDISSIVRAMGGRMRQRESTRYQRRMLQGILRGASSRIGYLAGRVVGVRP